MTKSPKEIAEILKNDGIVIMQCDTILGLVGRMCRPVLERLQKLKNRPNDNPFILLIPNPSHVDHLADTVSSEEQYLMTNFWPGPLTIVLDRHPCLSADITAGKSTIAVRYPNFDSLNEVLNELNEPVFSTSVNISSNPPAQTIDDIPHDIASEVDYIWDNAPGLTQESTIVKCENGFVNVLREGAVKL